MLRVTIPLSLFARVVGVADDGRLGERPPLWRLAAAPDRHGSLCPDLSDKAEPDSRALTLLRVARFTVFGAAKQRSSRRAAALIITSYASVSLTLVIQPLLPSRRPDYLGPSPERAPDRESPLTSLLSALAFWSDRRPVDRQPYKDFMRRTSQKKRSGPRESTGRSQ
jgi:hypothetical protein